MHAGGPVYESDDVVAGAGPPHCSHVSTTTHREREFSTGGTESPEIWDGCGRRPVGQWGGGKRPRRSRAVTDCTFQTSSEHSTSLGRVGYQHCVCGRFRVL